MLIFTWYGSRDTSAASAKRDAVVSVRLQQIEHPSVDGGISYATVERRLGSYSPADHVVRLDTSDE